MADAATRAQNTASEPLASTWLSANAGSGKTKVLTDRVARLLLRGVAPSRVLCLTYTKAAASEMQNRLFRLLGGWAMLPDANLRAALSRIDEDVTGPDALARARRLFARALETPGGLKIQTIHSFCAGLLRRFPLEAGLSPGFTEMDERSIRKLRAQVLEYLAEGDGAPRILHLAQQMGDSIDPLLAEICALAPAFGPGADLAGLFDLPAGYSEAALLADVYLGNEADLLTALLPHLDRGRTTDIKHAAILRSVLSAGLDVAALPALEKLFLTQEGAKEPFTAKFDAFPTKDVRLGLGPLLDPLHDLMRRVEAVRPRRIALAGLQSAQALHDFAALFLPAYETAKAARGWLDFDDLIGRTAALLADPGVAQWVLWKLDGGVDHILVDEAQDTSPAQWQVVEYLTQEFTAGQGARDAERTLFVVGDKKQSIYSFQGADLLVFDRMQALFRDRLAAIGLRLNEALLAHSFRSSDAVLRVVDQTFAGDAAVGLGGPPVHVAFRPDLPGRVDLWPALGKADTPHEAEWHKPVDVLPDEHHTRRLARMIAAEVRRMIDTGTCIPAPAGPRPVTEGDFLILVQRRGPLFHELIAACKAEGLAIAGADRLRLGGEMAVRDLTALLAFLAVPEDDLNLACLLRSPMCGWSEDALFRLAHPRKGYLWQALRDADAPETREFLDDLRGQVDFLRPYDLLERALTRHDGRRKLIARLGEEAHDGIDAFLAQALTYEQVETPSLTGFLDWLGQDDVQIKRELGAAEGRLRVMSVHGAKGLEAPIVILPDTADRRSSDRARLMTTQGIAVPRATASTRTPVVAAEVVSLSARSAEEDARLLYVAMTRAEYWLIVAAAGEVKQSACWHNLVRAGLLAAGAIQHDFPAGQGLRHAHGPWPAPMTTIPPLSAAPVDLPDWLDQPASPVVVPPVVLTPSGLGGAKALPGEAALSDEHALARGTALHLLLEHLPHWPEATWDLRAANLLAAADLPLDPAPLLQEASRILSDPELAPLFAAGTLAEVPFAATLWGRPLQGAIDRLVIDDDRVLAVDYKSNRILPDSAQATPDGLLRQMAAYRAALLQVFPGKPVQVALLWTQGPLLMVLPDDLLADALARAALELGARGA